MTCGICGYRYDIKEVATLQEAGQQLEVTVDGNAKESAVYKL